MTEIIVTIAQYYPQITGYILISFLIAWVFYKFFKAFTNLERKIDLMSERMATKTDLQEVKDELSGELNGLKVKVGVIEEKVGTIGKKVEIIEEKVNVLWEQRFRRGSGWDYDLPIVRDGE